MYVDRYDHATRRKYMNAYYVKRIDRARNLLGSMCVRCGSTDMLEFDHVDPSTKVAPIARILMGRWAFVEEELKKCQLLCRPCHMEKSAEDLRKAGRARLISPL